jgi:hypothetical protein
LAVCWMQCNLADSEAARLWDHLFREQAFQVQRHQWAA